MLARLGARERRQVLDGLQHLLRALRNETEACCSGAYEHLMAGAAKNDDPKPPTYECEVRR